MREHEFTDAEATLLMELVENRMNELDADMVRHEEAGRPEMVTIIKRRLEVVDSTYAEILRVRY